MPKIPIVNLGNAGLKVSKLGFAPFSNITPEEGGRILAEAYKLGVNFWDTSDDYGTYLHIASALKHVPRKEVVISTKTYARTGKNAEESLKNSLKEFGTDYLDIFLLHFVQSDWSSNCQHVLKEMRKLKMTGIVKAVGLSTHSVAIAKKAASFEDLDVIMAICCKVSQFLVNRFRDNIPLEDGSMKEMFHTLKLAHNNGKGIVAMKVLGGGTPLLIKNYKRAIRAVALLDFIGAMVIGIRSLEEAKKNVKAITST